jgi:hypothetical protein
VVVESVNSDSYARYCDVEVAALVVASVEEAVDVSGGEVGGGELAAIMTVSVVVEVVVPSLDERVELAIVKLQPLI